MCHLGVNQLITVYHFSLLCKMDESSSRFRIPKSSNEEKASIINSVPRYRFFENGKAKEQTRFALKTLKTLVWMCKSCLKALKT